MNVKRSVIKLVSKDEEYRQSFKLAICQGELPYQVVMTSRLDGDE